MIIIGSEAIKYWFGLFPREPKDLDVVLEEGEELSLQLTYKRIERLENPILKKYHYKANKYLSPDMLYTLKMSHLFWDISWEKHMFDAQFLRSKGCTLNKDAFHELYGYWNKIHGDNKRSDLKMTADDFFDNAVKSEYSHDDVHTLLNPTPIYTKVLIGEVEVGEEKFNSLSYEDKCALVYEEVMVMAWERYKRLDYRVAYARMLKKFIINHAPLWEAIFIIENFIELHKPKFNYYERINEGISKIKPNSKRLTKA